MLWTSIPANFRINMCIVEHSDNIPKSSRDKIDFRDLPEFSMTHGHTNENFFQNFFQNFFESNAELGCKHTNNSLIEFLLCIFKLDHCQTEERTTRVRRNHIISCPYLAVFNFEPVEKYTKASLKSETFDPDISTMHDVTDDITKCVHLFLDQVNTKCALFKTKF